MLKQVQELRLKLRARIAHGLQRCFRSGQGAQGGGDGSAPQEALILQPCVRLGHFFRATSEIRTWTRTWTRNLDKFYHVFSSCRATCPSSARELGQGTWTTAGCRVTMCSRLRNKASSCSSLGPLEAASGWYWITGAYTTTRRWVEGGSDVFTLTQSFFEKKKSYNPCKKQTREAALRSLRRVYLRAGSSRRARWTCTQADFINFSQNTRGKTKYGLVVMDVFTREAAVEPLQNKNAETVDRTTQACHAEAGDDKNFVVTTDLGNEFETLDRELPAEAPEDRNATAVVGRPGNPDAEEGPGPQQGGQ